MMKRTDKTLSPLVQVSGAVYYSKQVGRDKINNLVKMVELTMPVFRTLLNLPEDLMIRLATHRRYFGTYHNSALTATISPLLKYGKFMQVLAHELVHAEQYYEGRLSMGIYRGRYVNVWKGVRYEIVTPGVNYNHYRTQPWEAEAYGREEELATEVNRILNERMFSNS